MSVDAIGFGWADVGLCAAKRAVFSFIVDESIVFWRLKLLLIDDLSDDTPPLLLPDDEWFVVPEVLLLLFVLFVLLLLLVAAAAAAVGGPTPIMKRWKISIIIFWLSRVTFSQQLVSTMKVEWYIEWILFCSLFSFLF